jgi:chaperone required for assembly of F1-ATPase
MRDIFTQIFENQPLDPIEAARRAVRPRLRNRFYKRAHVGEPAANGGFPILLDNRPVKTPARRDLAAPTRALAEELAREWQAQTELIDPARMPLARLANAAIDGVADAPEAVAAAVAKYLSSDLVFYRADAPAGLVARQARHWDPLLAFARDELDARFIAVEGIVFAEQPPEAVAAARRYVPAGTRGANDIWRLAATSSITTLTGSALIALALAHGALDVDAAWAAAHVDEDWQMEQWGRDQIALDALAFRHSEMQAAATVLRLIG